MIQKVLEVIKQSKGVATAKGKYIDYREAHKLQYAFMQGLVTIRPSQAVKRVKANNLKFIEWEDSEGQYYDYAFLAGYVIKFPLASQFGMSFLIPSE